MSAGIADYDAIILGGGFYGVAIAIHLRQHRGVKRILLVEQEPSLLNRASRFNQARVHNGYHYPRSLVTAFRSRINLPRFVRDWPDAVRNDFQKVYAIGRRHSKVTAKQFERFCREIGAPIEPAPRSLNRLFEPKLIEASYLVQEYAFDVNRLQSWAMAELQSHNVEVRTSTCATEVLRDEAGSLRVVLVGPKGESKSCTSPLVLNCTYSGLNQLGGEFPLLQLKLKHEIAEMALLEMPPQLAKLGITVMDGPFFSAMPYPARGLHTLSHVRFTPHMHWEDDRGVDPYERLATYHKDTRVDRMVRDVARYMPAISGARHVESIFEVKTVLTKSEGDDGRPIVFERHGNLPGCYSVLGGKLDNIYDILEKLDEELSRIARQASCSKKDNL